MFGALLCLLDVYGDLYVYCGVWLAIAFGLVVLLIVLVMFWCAYTVRLCCGFCVFVGIVVGCCLRFWVALCLRCGCVCFGFGYCLRAW